MFAALSPMQQHAPDSFSYPWTPTRSSPLSPRRATSLSFKTTPPTNQPQFQAPASIFAFTPSPSPSHNKSEPVNIFSRLQSPNADADANASISPTPAPTTYATRYASTISNPLNAHSTKRTFTSSTSPRARSVRRNAFLNRVKQDRESGRFEARAERLAYLEDIAEHKEWVENMRRRADEIQSKFGLGIEETEGEGEHSDGDEAEIQALDEYLEQEHAMEMELLERMENVGHAPRADVPKQNDAASSFSDEEYDDIFMDLVNHNAPEDMDMSS